MEAETVRINDTEIHICDCGKRCYSSARLARLAHRSAGFRLWVYRYDLSDSWHTWHASNAEKAGCRDCY